ncbi:GTP cyclohydrolase II, partial [Gamsiella multidivaricata]
MACDISMNEAAPIAVHHQGYIPRNAIDHMNPFFFKSHQHTHSHAHYGHSHGHHNHPSSHHPIRQQPYTAPSHTHTTTASSKNKDTSPDTHPSSASTTSPSPVDLQTPVPRRMSAQIDPLTLLNTPPATPPLTVLSQKQYPSNVPSTTPASILRSSTNTSTAASSKEDKDEVEDKADPLAWCAARARIPTPDGSEYFLHIYENKQDKKEHLAFVFGDAIRSRTLDRVQPNETEMDRLRRGAYTGRLQNMVDADQQPPSGPFRTATATATTTATATATVTVTTETVVEFDKDQDTVMESTTTEVEASMSTTSTMASSVASAGAAPLVRIHSECFTGEIGHSARCDCGEQLDEAIRLMKAQGCGVVVYLRQEGRGIGLGEKL